MAYELYPCQGTRRGLDAQFGPARLRGARIFDETL